MEYHLWTGTRMPNEFMNQNLLFMNSALQLTAGAAQSADASAQSAIASKNAAGASATQAGESVGQANQILQQVLEYGNGWTPNVALVNVGDETFMRVLSWYGGRGTAPESGYWGPGGIVPTTVGATNLRGRAGGEFGVQELIYNNSANFVRANYPWARLAIVELWGGGCSGMALGQQYANTSVARFRPEGGWFASGVFVVANLPDSVSVVTGVGGAARSVSDASSAPVANPGGATSFGALLSAPGGRFVANSSAMLDRSYSPGFPGGLPSGLTVSISGAPHVLVGGGYGGGALFGGNEFGGSSGNGGTGGNSGNNANGTAGAVPGGGGGSAVYVSGAANQSGAGGRGRARILLLGAL